MSDTLALIPGAAAAQLSASDAPGVLRALAARLREAGAVTDGFEAAVIAREQSYPTGLPTAIPAAIPHTDPEHVLTPGLAVATLTEPVDFGEMSGGGRTVAVRLVVMLVLADAHAQLAALQAVVAGLQDTEAVEHLLSARDDAALAAAVAQWLGGGAPRR